MRLNRTLVTPLALGSLLLLTACSSGTTTDEGEKDDRTSAVEETKDSATADPTKEAAADEDTDAADVTSEGPACLVGSWEVDIDALRENTLGGPEMAGLGAEITVSGESWVEIDASTMNTEYRDQLTEVSMTIEEQTILSRTTYNGVSTSSYTATDTALTVSDVDISALEISSTSIVNGEEMEVPGLGDAESLGIELGGVSTYTCNGDELRITPQVEGMDVSSFVQVLHRR
ncbi:hypothetical protein [Cellulomonas sp. KRMCY2]|uniref:hypothetical protein n=1 Tax=Cellulomonas sp. KRMCY2 TaxID=1304865 RepID=UPI00045E78E3|nr:hypothetical protein [Cellulomonas sp. KRMCY2]